MEGRDGAGGRGGGGAHEGGLCFNEAALAAVRDGSVLSCTSVWMIERHSNMWGGGGEIVGLRKNCGTAYLALIGRMAEEFQRMLAMRG